MPYLSNGSASGIATPTGTTVYDNLIANSGLTISVWLYYVSSGTGTTPVIMDKRNTGANGWIFSLVGAAGANAGIRMFVDSTVGNMQLISSSNVVTPGVWDHYLLTGSGTVLRSNYHIYKNGVEIAYTGGSDGTGGVPSDTANRVGIAFRVNVQSVLSGAITELAMWNTVISPAQITALASSKIKGLPLQIQPLNLIGYWPLDEYAGGTPFSTASGAVIDRSSRQIKSTAAAGAFGLSESVLSYP